MDFRAQFSIPSCALEGTSVIVIGVRDGWITTLHVASFPTNDVLLQYGYEITRFFNQMVTLEDRLYKTCNRLVNVGTTKGQTTLSHVLTKKWLKYLADFNKKNERLIRG